MTAVDGVLCTSLNVLPQMDNNESSDVNGNEDVESSSVLEESFTDGISVIAVEEGGTGEYVRKTGVKIVGLSGKTDGKTIEQESNEDRKNADDDRDDAGGEINDDDNGDMNGRADDDDEASTSLPSAASSNKTSK